MIDAMGLAIGAAISWLLTHVYHLRADRDQKAIYDKMSQELKSAIRDNHRGNLTVADLNDLLKKQTVDETTADKLPYIACPRCGSRQIERLQKAIVDFDAGDDGEPCPSGFPYEAVRCLACDWHTSELAVADPDDV